MTVCIATLADAGNSLVLVSDTMLSMPEVSGDRAAYKYFPLSSQFQWWAMVAAEDVTHVAPVIDATVRQMFALTPHTNTYENVERAALTAYQAVRQEYAQDLILSPLRLTFDSLHATNWQADLIDRVSEVSLGCEFLIAGFDLVGRGHIFSVEHPGISRNHNMSGYAAIGSGAYAAMSSLLFQSVNSEMELARIVYHACEAKFMAESAEGVGRHTYLKVAIAEGRMDALQAGEQFVAAIRSDWEEHGKPRVPPGTVDQIRTKLALNPSFRNRFSPGAPPIPQSTTGDPSRQRPSPESPGGSDES